MATSDEAARPGTSYFVPGVRVAKLGELRAGRDPGEALPADVLGDVVSVEVTRVNTGGSQFTLTLNNWYSTTAIDRREAPGSRELQGRDRPAWPRYKYNDFSLIAFGDRLRIDMRYWPEPAKQGLDARARATADWVPMVTGPVTDMRFSFATGEGAQVVVSGEDDLSPLKDKHTGRVEYQHLSEQTIVRRVLAEASYPLSSIAPPRVDWPQFATDDSNGIDEALQDGQSYLEYLQKLAERLDFEVFMEATDLADADAGVTFHFEPARSRLPPDGTLRDIFVLRRDQNLLDFSPTIKVVDQYSSVSVKGRHRDPGRPERVDQSVKPSVLDDELHIDPAQGDQRLSTGSEIRDRFFPGRPNDYTVPNQTNIDDERAQWLAEAILRAKAREFLTIEATTIGLPRLRPGNHVEIRGMRPPFDGFYYVTRTVHSVGADGFRTQFSARRPGMPAPPYSE